ncbi:MAG: CerR family C-terminal domain-containing protein [Sedimentisphaerales bacterium]|nr:CerR family C-terminal domain-containing protein [Sedimentisphaerales bacterium]
MVISKEKIVAGNTEKGVQDRLLNAAEELFCEKGYAGTSVRDIAASAGCNVASVNYYFGGKEKLYEEVWRRHLIPMRDARVSSIEKVLSQGEGHYTLEDLLRSFAETFIGPLVEARRTSRLSKLLARECMERHLPVTMFADEVIKPTLATMRTALIQCCSHLSESTIPLITFSLVGQLVHVVHVRAIFEQGDENLDLPVFDLGKAIDHIVNFSAAGIRAYAEGKII